MRAVATLTCALVSGLALGACNPADRAAHVPSSPIELRDAGTARATTIVRRQPGELVPNRILDGGAPTHAIVSPPENDLRSVAHARPRTRRASPRQAETAADLEASTELGEPSGPEWVCAHVSRGVRVDPAEEDQAPCTWVRRPSCPGMFVVFHHSGTGLFGTCASTLPP